MNKVVKRTFYVITLLIVLVLAATGMTACGETEKEITKLQIVSGSFKTSYKLDEEVTLDAVKLVVSYVDGTSQNVTVGKEAVSGFDVHTTGTNKTLTVTYKGVTATFIYNVIGSTTVTTPVRLGMELTSGTENDVVTLSLSRLNEMPILAFKVTLTATKLTYVGTDFMLSEDDWGLSTYESDGKLTAVIYAKDGESALAGNCSVIAVKYRSQSGAKLVASAISVSDGTTDHTVPTTELVW